MTNISRRQLSRRQLLELFIASGTSVALPGCASRQAVVDLTEIYGCNPKAAKQYLKRLDSFVGKTGLEGFLQAEYDKGPDSKFKLRAAPSVAQLPYGRIVSAVRASDLNELVVLYPGAGDDATSILFAHLLSKAAERPTKVICTEIDDQHPESFRVQLQQLKQRRLLDYSVDKRVNEELTEVAFDILTPASRFKVEYHVRKNPADYFTPDEAQQAALFRENFTTNEAPDYGLIARMTKAGFRPGRPIVIVMPDYGKLGKEYMERVNPLYDPCIMPDRYISHTELVESEKKFGAFGPLGIFATSEEDKRAREEANRSPPIKNSHFWTNLSRGNGACSCNPCMKKFRKYGKQRTAYTYSVILQPGPEAGGMSEESIGRELRDLLDVQLHATYDENVRVRSN